VLALALVVQQELRQLLQQKIVPKRLSELELLSQGQECPALVSVVLVPQALEPAKVHLR
jgi:hypothetical protein